MPTTTYNIDRIIERVPNMSRATILDVLNEIQLIVYSQDCQQTQKLLSTGEPPYIITQDEVYQYNCPVDCRRTEMIFTASFPATRSRIRPIGPRIEYYFRNKGYYQVAANSRDALPGQVATVTFSKNPGPTTDAYFHLYYVKATPITDETIQLTIPEELHWLVRKAVVAMFTTEEYGDSPMDEQVIEKVARKIRNQLNRGFQSNLGQTPVQEQYQDVLSSFYRYRM